MSIDRERAAQRLLDKQRNAMWEAETERIKEKVLDAAHRGEMDNGTALLTFLRGMHEARVKADAFGQPPDPVDVLMHQASRLSLDARQRLLWRLVEDLSKEMGVPMTELLV